MDAFYYEKILDVFLKYLIDLPDQNARIVGQIKKDMNNVYSLKDVIEIINKLREDGFASPDYFDTGNPTRESKFTSTFNGRMFLSNGGYTEQKRLNILVAQSLEIDQNIRKRNERVVAQGTILAAIGTLCLFLWEVWKFAFPVYQHLLHYLFCSGR